MGLGSTKLRGCSLQIDYNITYKRITYQINIRYKLYNSKNAKIQQAS